MDSYYTDYYTDSVNELEIIKSKNENKNENSHHVHSDDKSKSKIKNDVSMVKTSLIDAIAINEIIRNDHFDKERLHEKQILKYNIMVFSCVLTIILFIIIFLEKE
jgi:hypothetical protein